jgi:hypothetical protein
MLVHHLQCRLSPSFLSITPYRCSSPLERSGSSGQTSLVAATSQSVHFARSLATRFQAGQRHLNTRGCPPKWVGGKRACTLVAGTQDFGFSTAFKIVSLCKIQRVLILISSEGKLSHSDLVSVISSLPQGVPVNYLSFVSFCLYLLHMCPADCILLFVFIRCAVSAIDHLAACSAHQ